MNARMALGAALLFAACAGSTASAPATLGPTTPSHEPTSQLHRVTDSVFAVEHGSHWNAFVVTSVGVVVIDPTSDAAARRLVAIIREVAPEQPLAAIIYSHWHLDHATGANVLRQALGADAPIYAHERAAARLREYDGTGIEDVALPTQTVGDEPSQLTFGGHTIGLSYMGHAHTDTMMVVAIEPDSVVYACDFVANESVGYRDLPGVDLLELVGMLHRLEAIEHAHTLFGHSRPGNRESVARFRGYIEDLWTATAGAIAEDLGADAAAARVTESLPQYRTWSNADIWFEANARGVYRWLSEHPDAVMPEGPTPIQRVE